MVLVVVMLLVVVMALSVVVVVVSSVVVVSVVVVSVVVVSVYDPEWAFGIPPPRKEKKTGKYKTPVFPIQNFNVHIWK